MNENEELDLDLDELDQIDANADRKLQVKNRFQKLANDKRTLAQEKEAAEKAKAESEAKLQALEKETNFYKSFSQLSSKHPEASNYQDQIKERVDKGYDPEEAMFAVLAKEGKLGNQAPAPSRTEQAEGGSAMTQLSEGDKTVNQLNEGEKLSALQELEKSGELTQILRAGINRS